MKTEIEHEGWVTEIEKDVVRVQVNIKSPCFACGTKDTCAFSDASKYRIIEVPITKPDEYFLHQKVILATRQSTGNIAVLFFYILPLIFLLTSLIFINIFTKNELVSALTAIVTVGVYYYVLSLFKDRIKKKFKFTIKPENAHLDLNHEYLYYKCR